MNALLELVTSELTLVGGYGRPSWAGAETPLSKAEETANPRPRLGEGPMQDVVFRSGTCGISLRGAGHRPGDDREPGASPAPGAAPSRERWSIVIVK